MSTDPASNLPATRRPVFLQSAVVILGVWLVGGFGFALVLAQGPKNEGWQWVFLLGLMGVSAVFVFAVCGVLAGISLARSESRPRTAATLLAISCAVVWLLKGMAYRLIQGLLN